MKRCALVLAALLCLGTKETGAPDTSHIAADVYNEERLAVYNPSDQSHWNLVRTMLANPNARYAVPINHGFAGPGIYNAATCLTRVTAPIRFRFHSVADINPGDAVTFEDAQGNVLPWEATVSQPSSTPSGGCNYGNNEICWLDMTMVGGQNQEAVHKGDVAVGPGWRHVVRETQYQGPDEDCVWSRMKRIITRHGWDSDHQFCANLKAFGIQIKPGEDLTGLQRSYFAWIDGTTHNFYQDLWELTYGLDLALHPSMDPTWRSRIPGGVPACCWDGFTASTCQPSDQCPVPKLTPSDTEWRIESWVLRIDQVAMHSWMAQRQCQTLVDLGSNCKLEGAKRSWYWDAVRTGYEENYCHEPGSSMACGRARPANTDACSYAGDMPCEGPIVPLDSAILAPEWADDYPDKLYAYEQTLQATCSPDAQMQNSRVGPNEPLWRGGELPRALWSEPWYEGEATSGLKPPSWDPPEVP